MKIGASSLLTILFVVLKLGGLITWSWLWVLSPLWLPILASLVYLGGICLIAGFALVAAMLGVALDEKNRRKPK